MMRRPNGRLLIALPFVFSLGCASVSRERGHDRVADLVRERAGRRTQWEKGPPDDARVAEWVRATVQGGLTRRGAVEIALVNSPELTVAYEELGISQADMVQAGLLSNPALGMELGLPVTSQGLSELRFSLVQNLLDLIVLPSRKEIARQQFEADTLRTADHALRIAAEAERAFTDAQASAQLVVFRQTVAAAAEAAAYLADRQFEAGTINQLDRTAERATFEQARLDLAREEIAHLEAREHVNRLLGLWGEMTTWKLAEPLPDVPATEPTLEHLESTAIRQRLDVAAARTQTALLSKAVGLARSTRAFGRIEVGVDMHRDPDGPRVIGPNLVIDLPIFDQRQAAIARLEAQRRQQERRLAGLSITARSEVRLADARRRAARQTALHYRDTLVPLRRTVLDQSLLHYNGMFIGAFQLLTAKQAEVEARRGYIEAIRDYWNARAELARAVGGALPPPSPPPPSTPESKPLEPASPSKGTHDHGH
jgi:cobalt-zinc-cadmium efflux system outer membrane protein